MVDDGRTTDGRTTEHGYTISSPCEPDGSGELKSYYLTVSVIVSSRPQPTQSFLENTPSPIDIKTTSVQLIVNEWSLNVGKLPLQRLAQRECG